jgi:hypothetical protein
MTRSYTLEAEKCNPESKARPRCFGSCLVKASVWVAELARVQDFGILANSATPEVSLD